MGAISTPRTLHVAGAPMSPPDHVRARLAHGLLIGVCLAYVAMIAIRTSQTIAPTWDEVVYLSQVVRDVPAASFSAPRSRGMPILLAPVASITSSMFPIRVFLALGSGLLMYLAFRPWQLALRAKEPLAVFVAPLAAALFATLWMTTFYGAMAYPNLWLAFTLVAGAGLFCVAVQKGRATVPVLVGLLAAFAIASLLRPTDTLAAVAPLIAIALLVPSWHRFLPAAIVLGGVALGWAAWIAEAIARFGGPVQRFREGAEVNEGRFTWSLPKHLDALDGPFLLCRPHDICEGFTWSAAAWWLAVPLAVVLGLVVAHRQRWLTAGLLAASSALAIAAPYFLVIDYAAPRFLLPTYAFLAIPAAAGLLWLGNRRRVATRAVAIASMVGLLSAHVVTQQAILDDSYGFQRGVSDNHAMQAQFLRTSHGVRSPCLMVGLGAIQQSYLLQCRSEYATAESMVEQEPEIVAALRDGEQVVVRLRTDDAVPAFMDGWHLIELPETSSTVVYLPPNHNATNE